MMVLSFSRLRGILHRVTRLSFRGVVWLLAVVLIVTGAWTLVPSLVRSDLERTADPSPGGLDRREFLSSARLAAQLGLVRGDLWTDYAVVLASGGGGAAPGTDTSADTQAALSAGRRAARLAPHDPRAWLALAMLEAGRGAAPATVASLLRMSVLTGPSEPVLALARAAVAARSGAIEEPEIDDLLERDLRIIAGRSDAKTSFARLYREARPVGKVVLERMAIKIDPSLRAAFNGIR
jgi:hypothetical protein